ncbi:MAG: hypothetical protein ACI9WV_000844 [Patiriisocius sp.]|jgi:hypothetical protein
MRKRKDKWLQFGCFLTGYNYDLLMSCSEASKKSVKKYTSALLIIMILWFLIGFLFSQEYLKLSIEGAIASGVVLTIIIIQIERQIILGNKNKWSTLFRIVLGLVMAVLGSVIVDQIIFKEDIEKQKLLNVGDELARKLPQKVEEVNNQIAYFDKELIKKEKERTVLLEELTKKPTIRIPASSVERIPGKTTRTLIENGEVVTREVDTIYIKRKYESQSIQNPRIKLLPELEKQIENLRKNRIRLSNKKNTIREDFEKELLAKKGFLDELQVLFTILGSSLISCFVWGLWFVFFLIIELFVLVSKLSDSENDYQKIIKHQMDIRISALDQLKSNK